MSQLKSSWIIWAALLGAALLLALPIVASEDEPDPSARIFDGLRESLRSRERVRPASHSEDWLRLHGTAAGRAESGSCDSCHTDSQCAECHAGSSVPLAIHPPGYLAIHGFEAQRDTASCTSCHTPSMFCASCHTQASLTRVGSPSPLAIRVHPEHWLNPMASGNHAQEARRDVLACASCHSGDDCASCHAWVNPHGRDFRGRCAQLLNASPDTCAQCHTPTSMLPMPALRQHPSCAR